MAYGNYAPFYRPGYFNPMQPQGSYDGLNQPINQPINQAYQNQIPIAPQPASPVNDMVWVLNESEATSYPVAPNTTVILWDKNEPTIYIKSVNAQGIPSMRILDFAERTQNASETRREHVCNCGKDFVRIDDFKTLEQKYIDLESRLEAMSSKSATKSKKATSESEEK